MKKMIWKGSRRPIQDENLVTYKFEGGEFEANLPLFLEEVNHSPTGFEWGYRGSGPAQLAYAILRTYFEISDGLEKEHAIRQAAKFSWKFKEDFVCAWKGDEWEITSDEISFWLDEERMSRL
jgi:hypothetical protein